MLTTMGQKEDLDLFEANIEKLKFDYDQYFQGFSKRPPDKLRRDTDRMALKFIGFRSPNTALRFRAQNLIQRMTSYRQLWDKILQQIEDGTYKRDIYRANLKARFQAPPKPGGHDEVIEDAEMLEEEPAEPAKKWGHVFDQYMNARTQTQEGTAGISYEKLHDLLEKQAAQLREKYQAKDIEFRVVIENGKTRLKATPKR